MVTQRLSERLGGILQQTDDNLVQPLSVEAFVEQYLATHPRWSWPELKAAFFQAVSQGVFDAGEADISVPPETDSQPRTP